MSTRRVDALDRGVLAHAISTSGSWREVGRRLDLRAARDLAAVRRRCDVEGVDASHLPGPQADARFAEVVRQAVDWHALLEGCGYAPGSGSARASLRRRARRLGLDLGHLDAPLPSTGSATLSLGPARPELLRTAAPAIVAAELLQRGCGVSWPVEPVAYDLVASLPAAAGLLRVQVKSGTVRRGSSWAVRLSRSERAAGGTYGVEEVDAFAVVGGDRAVYLVPVAVLEGQTAVLTSALQPYRLLA